MSTKNPAARRHTLLFAAVVFLLIAGFIDPGILHRFACQAGIVTAAFLVIAAFLAAKGIRKLADVFFRGSARPWYGRAGVVVFLCIVLPCVNIVFIIIDNMFFDITAISQVTGQQVRMFVFMALELLWIALLE
jgi:hypothetical protein